MNSKYSTHETSNSNPVLLTRCSHLWRKGSWSWLTLIRIQQWAVSWWTLSVTSILHITSHWSLHVNSVLWLADDPCYTCGMSQYTRAAEMLAAVTWQTSGCNENLITHDTNLIIAGSINLKLTFPWPRFMMSQRCLSLWWGEPGLDPQQNARGDVFRLDRKKITITFTI